MKHKPPLIHTMQSLNQNDKIISSYYQFWYEFPYFLRTWHKYIFNDISALNDISYKIKCITLHTKNLKTKKILGEVIFINQAWWHELSWGLEYEIDNILGKWSPSRDGTLVLRCINLWIFFAVVMQLLCWMDKKYVHGILCFGIYRKI